MNWSNMNVKKTLSRGFTLLEVIMVIIIGGILSAVFLPYSGTVLRGSVESLLNIDRQGNVHNVMERITAEHLRFVLSSKKPLEDLKTKIESIGSSFGEFEIVECKFISFDPVTHKQTSAGSSKNLLLVSIKADRVPLTAIFGE